jgi:hypothetical protein
MKKQFAKEISERSSEDQIAEVTQAKLLTIAIDSPSYTSTRVN